jgi:hypothetical protein
MKTALDLKIKSELLGATFHGKHEDGRYRVKVNERNALATAAVYELVPKVAKMPNGQLTRQEVGVTPGYKAGLIDEVSFVAACPKTDKRYRLIGVLKFLTPKIEKLNKVVEVPKPLQAEPQSVPIAGVLAPTAPQTSDLSNKPSLVLSPISPLPSLQPAVIPAEVELPLKLQEKQATMERQLAAFQSELASVTAQRDAGHDPLVSVHFATKYLCRSRASLYRDIGSSVLTSIKVGHSSRLLLSALDALKTGATIA